MFKKTYGILYEQNAYVFTDFFKELETYYAKGTVSLTFFHALSLSFSFLSQSRHFQSMLKGRSGNLSY